MTRAWSRPRTLHILLLAALAALAFAVLAPREARAGTGQESIFQDDTQLLLRGSAVRNQNLDRLQAFGVDTIRVLVFWRDLAPQPLSKTKPAGFDGSHPSDYAPASWDRWDALVRGAQARGIKVLLVPNGSAPLWATGRGGTVNDDYKFDPVEFGKFVHAVGERYSGTYTDENGGGTLPRVGSWSLINEPNIGGWLQPQWEKVKIGRKRKTIPMSPHVYRRLFLAGQAALQQTGHGSDRIFLGETAPRGGSGKQPAGQMDPGLFLRELFCVDKRFRKFRGAAAKVRGCKGYKKLHATAYAHHPYVISIAPTTVPRNKDEFPIGNTRRLTKLLDTAARKGRVNKLNVFFTEFGVQSNPPDRFAGVTLATQADYLNISEYLAYKNSRVRAWAQYLMDDDALLTQFGPTNPRRYGGFQTGLRFDDDRGKPAFDAYRLPLVINKLSSSKQEIFGGVRPANGPTQVAVEFSPNSSAPFTTLTTVQITNPQGYFDLQRSVPGAAAGRFRLRWTAPDSTVFVSRIAKLAKISKAQSR